MSLIFVQLEIFYIRLLAGEYDDPLTLAQGLESLANQAWDEVDEFYPPSLRIEP